MILPQVRCTTQSAWPREEQDLSLGLTFPISSFCHFPELDFFSSLKASTTLSHPQLITFKLSFSSSYFCNNRNTKLEWIWSLLHASVCVQLKRIMYWTKPGGDTRVLHQLKYISVLVSWALHTDLLNKGLFNVLSAERDLARDSLLDIIRCGWNAPQS